MAVACPHCGRQYDVTLFEFGRIVTCICGRTVALRHEEGGVGAFLARLSEDMRVREIGRMADRISSLIVASGYPMIDIEIEKQKLREMIEEMFPDKTDLYGLIYEPRFRRLEEQFRQQENVD